MNSITSGMAAVVVSLVFASAAVAENAEGLTQHDSFQHKARDFERIPAKDESANQAAANHVTDAEELSHDQRSSFSDAEVSDSNHGMIHFFNNATLNTQTRGPILPGVSVKILNGLAASGPAMYSRTTIVQGK